MRKKIVKLIILLFSISVLVTLSFLIFKLTRPAVVDIVFNHPVDETTARKILDGYEIEMTAFRPKDGFPEIATSVYTTDVGSLFLIKKLIRQPQYKENKIQVLSVSSPVAPKSPKRFYNRYYDNLIESIINNFLLK